MSDQFETSFYSLLGVSSRASSKEIQAAYIRLSREFHPDSNTEAEAEAEERYKLISWAYAVIGRDPVVRAEYDRECRARAARGTLVPSEINL
ncbi:MAG TPA: DnaJ domain-containing protein, partial [Dermatophilaceae bacterium]